MVHSGRPLAESDVIIGRLRTALWNVARWRQDGEKQRVCFCDFQGRAPHSEECEEAADALGMDCGPFAVEAGVKP